VIGFIGMFGGFLMGILADKITVKKALVLAYLLLGVSFAAFADHRSLVVIYLGAALFGLAFNAIFGLIPAYVSLAYPTKATALIFGMGNVMLGLGAMTGNFLGGVLKDESGSFQQIYIVALVSAAALIVLAIFLRRPGAAS
jgi:MFS family permease